MARAVPGSAVARFAEAEGFVGLAIRENARFTSLFRTI
jgi:hypothetical protein